jgi:chaperone LolA
MHLQRMALFLASLLVAAVARADALADLRHSLEPLDSLAGEFRQVVLSSEGKTLEESRGRLALLRPAYFRWEIREPEEQLLVAADSVLWHYDVELESATRRRLDTTNPASPLSILGGDVAVLGEHYRVEALDDRGWLLVPRFEEAEFRSIELYFVAGLPSEMKVRDLLERETVITFSEVRQAPELTAGDFLFTPPPGVDVYENDG